MVGYLWKEINTEKNIPYAVTLLKSIEDPNAMFMLGEIYKGNIEYEKAFDCYLMAAERNHVYAQYDTALAYVTGQGTKRDIREAKKWLRSAASLGHSEARKKLERNGIDRVHIDHCFAFLMVTIFGISWLFIGTNII